MPAAKMQANSPDVFAELDAYSSQEDIRTAYGYEMISESEMDRLMNLWELREQSKQTEGPTVTGVLRCWNWPARPYGCLQCANSCI